MLCSRHLPTVVKLPWNSFNFSAFHYVCVRSDVRLCVYVCTQVCVHYTDFLVDQTQGLGVYILTLLWFSMLQAMTRVHPDLAGRMIASYLH